MRCLGRGFILLTVALSLGCPGEETPIHGDACSIGDNCAPDTAVVEDTGAWAPEISDNGQPEDTVLPAKDTVSVDSPEATDQSSPSADTPGPDIELPDTAAPTAPLSIQWTHPAAHAKQPVNVPFGVSLFVTNSPENISDLEIIVSSDVDGEIGTFKANETGIATFEITLKTPGLHQLKASVQTATNEAASDVLIIGACSYPPTETFDPGVPLSGWKFYGNAQLDSSGWIRLTSEAQGQQGGAFYVAQKATIADFRAGFSFFIGDGINGGAHGFAFNFIAAPTVFELDAIMQVTEGLGCLGFGVSGPCGAMFAESLHVEFDTWSDDGNPTQDPTLVDHIAVVPDGNPNIHLLWQPTPVLNDGMWHSVEISVKGDDIQVELDGLMVISGSPSGAYQFSSAFVGFTGTTGWATDRHLVDDFWMEQGCTVP